MESPTESTTERSPSEEAGWGHVKGLPCRLSVEIRVPHFTVSNLLDLVKGAILDTYHPEGSHVPVLVNGQMVAWGEFDVVDDALAIRLTELV